MFRLSVFALLAFAALAFADVRDLMMVSRPPQAPPEMMDAPAQAPAIPAAFCECGPGCACVNCLCPAQVIIKTEDAAVVEAASAYSLVYQMCVAAKVPLAVGVGFDPPAGGTYNVVQTRPDAFFPAGKIVVSRPQADGMYWVAELPGTATAADIQAALSPPKSVTGDVFGAYQQPTYGTFYGAGGCANGQCGTSMGFTGFQGGFQGGPPMRGIFRGGMMGSGCAGGVCR